MAKLLSILRGGALLVARLVLATILVAHGWERWQVRGIGSQVDYLERFGTPYPLYATWGAILLELFGGLLLAVGAFTPLVALAVVVEQILIVAWTNWHQGLALLNPDGSYAGGFEYNLALAALALLLTVFGAGGASVDRLFRRRKRVPEEEPVLPPGRRRGRQSYGGQSYGGQSYGGQSGSAGSTQL